MENAEPTEPMPGKAPGSGTTPVPAEEAGRKGGCHPDDEREESGRSGSATVSGTTVEGTQGGT